jgi:hypothetical protein
LPQEKFQECHIVPSEKIDRELAKGVLGAVLYATQLPNNKQVSNSHCSEIINEVLEQFKDIFAEPTKLPPQRECDHQIILHPGAKPVNKRAYRLPAYQKDALEKIIEQLLDSEVIRVSLSPYSSPAILVRKKDGSWRLCIDYRQLNANTIKNKYPIPVIEDLLDKLFGARFFSKIDLRSGYHQVRMKEQDVEKIAFSTHMGHYEFVVMPFGLTNAPATFQALMNKLLADHLRKFVLVFFDDIVIFSKTLEDHKIHLAQVFEILRNNQLFAKLTKCEFA